MSALKLPDSLAAARPMQYVTEAARLPYLPSKSELLETYQVRASYWKTHATWLGARLNWLKPLNALTLQRGVASTARHSINITCRGVTSPARHAARSHSFVYISTS
jgi:hypothetical protein